MPTTTLTERRKSLLPEAIFGAFDGMTSVYGVITGLLAAHGGKVMSAALGLAVSSALGMAGGQAQSDEDHSTPAALVMGVATFTGTLIPTLGFWFLPQAAAVVWMALSCLAVTGLIAFVRRAWVQSYAWFAVVAGVTLAVSLITGGSG